MSVSFRFLLNEVELKLTKQINLEFTPIFEDQFSKVDTHNFYLNVPKIAEFLACKGKVIFIAPKENATKEEIELYLNGTVLGAVLHQQNCLPFHASSFRLNNRGIMICGDSGMGKSTLTYGICLQNGSFLTDDITPVVSNNKPMIRPISDRMKLWNNTLVAFNIKTRNLNNVRPDFDKFFVEVDREISNNIPLDIIIFLSDEKSPKHLLKEIEGAEKMDLLMNQIYRHEILNGMIETKINYFTLLSEICNKVKFFSYIRKNEENVELSILSSIDFLLKNLS